MQVEEPTNQRRHFLTRKLSLTMVALVTTGMVLSSSYFVGAAVTANGFSGGIHKAPWTSGHRNAGVNDIDNSQCLICHQTSVPGSTVEDGDPATTPVRAAHATHIASIFLRFGSMTRVTDDASTNKVGCIFCHPDTNSSNYLRVGITAANTPISYEGDISYAATDDTATGIDESQALRRNVNPKFCRTCHGTRYQHTNGGNLVGCSLCHAWQEHENRNRVPYVNSYFVSTQVGDENHMYRSDSVCLRCHGGLPLYQGVEYNSMDMGQAKAGCSTKCHGSSPGRNTILPSRSHNNHGDPTCTSCHGAQDGSWTTYTEVAPGQPHPPRRENRPNVGATP